MNDTYTIRAYRVLHKMPRLEDQEAGNGVYKSERGAVSSLIPAHVREAGRWTKRTYQERLEALYRDFRVIPLVDIPMGGEAA